MNCVIRGPRSRLITWAQTKTMDSRLRKKKGGHPSEAKIEYDTRPGAFHLGTIENSHIAHRLGLKPHVTNPYIERGEDRNTVTSRYRDVAMALSHA